MFANLKFLIIFAIISRLAVVLYSIIFPVISENGERVSPLIKAINIGDMGYYDKFKDAPWDRFNLIFKINNYNKLIEWFSDEFDPGPIFPWLLKLTNYNDNNTLLLACIYLLISITTCIIWIAFLKKNGSTVGEQIVILIYPFGLYFSLIISTDLIFSLMVGSLYVLLCTDQLIKNKYNHLIALFFILLSLLTRPNSLILLPIYICYLIINKKKFSPLYFYGFNALSIGLIMFGIIYYYSYFMAFKIGSKNLTYFGFTQSQYINGLFDEIPTYWNYFFSWSALAFSKLLYVVGLRPSYSNVAIYYVFLRGIGGILILPGIFYLIIKRPIIEKIFIILFILPIMLGASQERYLLPIYPILMYCGIQFWKLMFNFFEIK